MPSSTIYVDTLVSTPLSVVVRNIITDHILALLRLGRIDRRCVSTCSKILVLAEEIYRKILTLTTCYLRTPLTCSELYTCLSKLYSDSLVLVDLSVHNCVELCSYENLTPRNRTTCPRK